MKILFLDVDGVLNSAETFHENHLKWKATGSPTKGEEFGYPLGHLHPSLINRLNTIVSLTGCNVVISSTWRHNGASQVAEWLYIKGFLFKDRVIGVTPILWEKRGYEIQSWLNDHADDVESFVILDDDSDMVHLMPYLVHVDGKVGLSDENVLDAIALLNGDIDCIAGLRIC